jgi:hypothetical protein
VEKKEIIFSKGGENEELIPLLTTNSIKTEIGEKRKEIQGIPQDLFKTEDENVSNGGTMAPIDEAVSENILERPPITNPTIDLRHRVLGLSQKGDWDACEVTLRMLEKEAAEEYNSKPLQNVTDEVVKYFNVITIRNAPKSMESRLQNDAFSGHRKYSSDVCSNGKQIDYSAADDKDGVRHQCGK